MYRERYKVSKTAYGLALVHCSGPQRVVDDEGLTTLVSFPTTKLQGNSLITSAPMRAKSL